MIYCCNPKCPKPDDPLNAGQLICCNCGSELLLQNRYRVLKLLGEGGFGKTFEVDDAGTRKVLKVLRKTYPKAVYLFQREAEVLKQLRHPGIPRVEADGYFTWLSGAGEPVHCLVMEKIDGQDLEKWLSDNQPITQERAIDWLKQLLEILDKLHRQQYFHRDINPRNIMLDRQGQLVLIDFGAVREITNTYLIGIVGEREGTRIGSPGYTPPEQVDGQAMPQSDFFALGRTFVYLLTGKSPLEFSKHPDTGKLIWRESAPQISPQLADLIDELMAPFPGLRPANAQVILQRLQAVEIGVPVGGQTSVPVAELNPPAVPQTGPTSRIADRPRLVTALLASVAIAALAVGLRQLGMLQAWELQAFDQLLRLRLDEGPDKRILVVEATEQDIQKYGYPLPDPILAKLFEKLDQYQPRVISLNIFRDIIVGNTPKTLEAYWQRNQHLIAACYASSPDSSNWPGIAPPKDVPEPRIGFTDVVMDSDGILRRHLVFKPLAPDSLCATKFSLSFRLAQRYLELEGIHPQTTPEKYVRLGKTVFKSLKASPGVYGKKELGGYQLLLNFRSFKKVAQTISLTEDSIIFDNTKIKRFVPGFTATIPFNAGIRRTIRWFEADPARMVVRQTTHDFFDRILADYDRAARVPPQ